MSARRTAAQLAELHRRLGRDLLLSWAGPAGAFSDGDLAVARRVSGSRAVTDLAVAAELDQAAQLLVNRLMTRRGELAGLGHPEYGSRHHELVGEPNTERTRNLVKLYVLEALRHEPRLAKVLRCTVRAEARPRDIVRIELQIRLIDRPEPLNMVVPFELEGAP
ncbi:MAG: GPW/gp25 family protein [Pseudonocardiaceae bacterium]|nr:GPW/gp25 family protein [Pseudonocardiaceae bacterium]